ncbi:hypothetical protein PsorP6_007954 [Peronosclerospora sorghi]|uniref:Uncharacterized protein n=1 Tax=Peronosclerospora sorghi TaxID=230839 RepID=A0ACC0WCT8_9STRA|nr:hypothetical protein PsorP6_007954 [Peronosclerospora sorghi]
MQDIDMIEASGDVWMPSDTEEEYCDMSFTVIHESVEIHSTNSMDIDGERENELSHNSSNSKSTSDHESVAGEQGSEASLDGFDNELELHLAQEYDEAAPSSEIGSESVSGEQGSEASVDGFDDEPELHLASEYDKAAPEIEIGSSKSYNSSHTHVYTRIEQCSLKGRA